MILCLNRQRPFESGHRAGVAPGRAQSFLRPCLSGWTPRGPSPLRGSFGSERSAQTWFCPSREAGGWEVIPQTPCISLLLRTLSLRPTLPSYVHASYVHRHVLFYMSRQRGTTARSRWRATLTCICTSLKGKVWDADTACLCPVLGFPRSPASPPAGTLLDSPVTPGSSACGPFPLSHHSDVTRPRGEWPGL